MLGLIAGTTMALNMLVAGTTSVVLALTLRRLGYDPATIAGVFDTMLTDQMGFVILPGAGDDLRLETNLVRRARSTCVVDVGTRFFRLPRAPVAALNREGT